MTDYPAEFKEDYSSQIPALQLLIHMGYTYLPPDEAMALRGDKTSNVILTGVLEPWLREHNHCNHKGNLVDFNDSNIRSALTRLTDINWAQGMIPVNQDLYENVLTQGISLEQTIDGNRRSYSLNFIDWQTPENNVYHVTEEFSVQRRGQSAHYRPDIIVFVNGIPLVVIECKRSDLSSSKNEKPVFQGITQHLRNQNWEDGIPSLYVYSQILLSVAVNDARYATTTTPAKFWSLWQEEMPVDEVVSELINRPLSDDNKQKLYHHESRSYGYKMQHYFDTLVEGGRLPTAQDKTLYAMLQPERLLELSYQYIVFDNGVKKIARYQQYFAIKATIDRVAHRVGESRNGGVIWHTTGSGKSLTMVMLSKALALHPSISNPRVILVTDRISLDKQISDTFRACGKTAARATSGSNLGKLIKDNSNDIITTIIDKFETTAKNAVLDDSADIFVLVDESHRSQYGTSHARMKQVFPNACYIGFTGTPLLVKDKETARKFGGFIHKYTMRQAVDDGAVVPLLYEGRIAEMDLNHKQLDMWFERRTKGLTDEQIIDLKRKMSRADEVNRVEQRIHYIAYDIAEHFKKNVNDGMKAQLATPSKEVGLMYREALQDEGINCELMISPPDTREGNTEVGQLQTPKAEQFWKDMMNRFGSDKNYNDGVRNQFADPDGIQLVIVVDKWLVGFDEPLNTVLYVDKPLKEHGLLQAIARVNRLFDGKDYGYIIDYRGVLGELNDAMETYNALEGFDSEDVAGTITDVAAVIDLLPQHHQQLLDVFKSIDNMQDKEALEQFLEPQDIRDHFYEMLNQYAKTLKVALASEIFYDNTSDKQIKRYQADLKTFHNLRQSVKQRYAEVIDYKDYEDKVRKVMDSYIGVTGVTTLTELVNIFDKEAFDAEVTRVEGATAKADTILYRLKKTITENMDTDPALYQKFSKMIDDTIQAFREGRLTDLALLEEATHILEAFHEGYLDGTPEKLRQNPEASAYHGQMLSILSEAKVDVDADRLVDVAVDIEDAIRQQKRRDWYQNTAVQNDMRNAVDDLLYDSGLQLNGNIVKTLIEQIIDIAVKRA
jgi:type I restriction enzyme, R subunit